MILSIFDGIELFAQYGIAGIAIAALIYIIIKFQKSLSEKDAVLLEQINKRDEQYIRLQERVLTALENNSNALEKLVEIVEEIKDEK